MAKMRKRPADAGSMVFSYLTLRKVVGLLGTALPFVLSLGGLLVFHTGLQSNLSGYYYTGMRDVYVGTLFAIGVFLLSYKGYQPVDNMAGNLACAFAVGLALFPTMPDVPASSARGLSSEAVLIGGVHFGFAALFFGTLIYFCMFVFTKTDPRVKPTRRKLERNRLYRGCGYIMALCMLLALVYYLLPDGAAASIAQYKPVYWLEAAAIVAFGVSWLTKGEAILRDE